MEIHKEEKTVRHLYTAGKTFPLASWRNNPT
jgi:hypothetical protein